ncbi:uncharacterized protein LOC18052064 [Citrus clementina]|nr:uncharacterized protein LOC18052064 [Citrus x clementina]
MASSRNKNVTVIFVLVLSLTFTTLAISSRSNRFVGNITEESNSENRSSGSGNWTAVSGGRPVQSGPNTFHHHKSCTENGDSNEIAVPDPRPVRSGSNPYHQNDNLTASQP